MASKPLVALPSSASADWSCRLYQNSSKTPEPCGFPGFFISIYKKHEPTYLNGGDTISNLYDRAEIYDLLEEDVEVYPCPSIGKEMPLKEMEWYVVMARKKN